jgi:vancomycin resistance protein YoaR
MSSIPYASPSRSTGWYWQLVQALIVAAVLFILAGVLTILGIQTWYADKIFPGVSVSGIDVGGKTLTQAASQIQASLSFSQAGHVILIDGERKWLATPAELGFYLDPEGTARTAYQVGRTGGLAASLTAEFNTWWTGKNLAPVVIFDQRTTLKYLQQLAGQVDHPVLEASLGLNGVEVDVHSGEVGRTLDIPATLMLLDVALRTMQDSAIPLVVHETPPVIMDASATAEAARKILAAPLTLTLPGGQSGGGPWTFDPPTLAKMLSIERVEGSGSASYQVVIKSDLLRTFLENLAPSLEISSQRARYIFNDDTRQLEVIQPAVIGRNLDVDASIKTVDEQLAKGQHNIALAIATTSPAASDSTTAEQLGIHSLVWAETSYFYGSSPERVQNIKTAASRFHGLLVAPGETFSMAQALGDVSLDNGYAEALIIYGNQTIKGVGGGVCQVSTTLFRAVFHAGYPIKERTPHAYRVGYYEQKSNGSSDPRLAGLDATVFVPLVDLKFTNDTPYWILMETYLEGYSLTWKLYSTPDGRSVDWDTTGPTETVDPPDPLYRENPDLSKGQIKQVDWAAQGAKITVTRTVSKDGSIYFQDTFFTEYEPWRAIYEYGPGTKDIPTPSSDH